MTTIQKYERFESSRYGRRYTDEFLTAIAADVPALVEAKAGVYASLIEKYGLTRNIVYSALAAARRRGLLSTSTLPRYRPPAARVLDPEELDEVVMLRLLRGREVETIVIPRGHKALYAAALQRRGWGYNPIMRALNMSGSSVREAVERYREVEL